MSQDVKKLISDQLQSRFQRLLVPYQEHVRVLIDQYEPLAHKFHRLSIQEVLKNISFRYTPHDWSEVKYLFQAIFVFILRAASPTLQMSTTEELVHKYPELTKEKTNTLVFLLEFWNLLAITLRIFDPNENAKDMMFFLERMCSPFQSSWNSSIHQRVRIFEAETKISLSMQCANDVLELRRPAAPHNNSTFNPAEILLQTQRQHQLVQEMQNREQQLLRFQKLYPQQDSQLISQQPQSQYALSNQTQTQSNLPNDHNSQSQQFQPIRTPFTPANPVLLSSVQQQRQQLEQQLFQRRQQSLQQLYQQPHAIKRDNTASSNYKSSSSSADHNQGNSGRFHTINNHATSGYQSSNGSSVNQRNTPHINNNMDNNLNTGRSNSIQAVHPVHSHYTHYTHYSHHTHNTHDHHSTIPYNSSNSTHYTNSYNSTSYHTSNSASNAHNNNPYNRKRTHSDTLQPDSKEQRVQFQQPSREEFWQQRVALMHNNNDIPFRMSMLPTTHSMFAYPTHDVSVTTNDKLVRNTSTTTLREVVKEVLREYNAKKEKREKRLDVYSDTTVS